MSTVKMANRHVGSYQLLISLIALALFLVACGGNTPPGSEKGRVSGTVQVAASSSGEEGTPLVGSAVTGAAEAHASSSAAPSLPTEPEFVPGEIVVRFAGGGLAAAALPVLEAAGESLRLERALAAEGMRLYVAPGLGEVETLAAVAELAARPDVVYAFPNYIYRPAVAPGDPLYAGQWHLPALNMEAAWDVTTGSSSVVVAVVDSGILASHPDFAGRLLPGYDFISEASSAGDGDGRDPDPSDDVFTGEGYHGTHVAGTIGAATNNGTGVAGVDWAARILPLRVLGSEGGSFVDVTDAMLWAVGGSVPGVPVTNSSPADVINLSLGGPHVCNQGWQDVIDTVSQFAVVVAAAGNTNSSANGFAPANCSDVIAVGATDFLGERAPYSNFGSAVDVMAPGGDLGARHFDASFPDGVLSLGNNGSAFGYAYMQGTSMAAPHISGVVALMKALDLSVDTNQALAALRESAAALSDAECDGAGASRKLFSEDCGAGLVDAALALQYVADGTVPPPNAGVLSFTPAMLELGVSSGEADYTIKNVGGAPVDWLLEVYEYAPDTPGATIPDEAVLTSKGEGTLAVGASERLTLYVRREELVQSGYYRFWLRFEVSGAAPQLYQVSFVHSAGEGVSLSGPMVVGAYQDDGSGGLVTTGSQRRSTAFSSFDFQVEPGRTLLGAWSDENDDGVVNGGDYIGFGQYFNVAAGQHVSGRNLTIAPVIGSPASSPAEYLRRLEEQP